MFGAPDQEMLDRWERRELVVYRFVPYVTLVISYFLTLWSTSPSPSLTVEISGLSVAAGLWVLVLVTIHPDWVEHRPKLMGLYFTGLLLVAGRLVIVAPWYGLFAFTGYIHAIIVLRGRWRVAGVLATAVITATSQNGGLPKSDTGSWVGYLVIIGFNLLLAGVMVWFGWVTQEQSARRKRANEELAEANRRLEASLEENRGLHALLLTQAREAGVTDERQRLAQEIHDTLAQGLIGIITQLQAADQARARAGAPLPEGEEHRHLEAARQLARTSLSEARRSVQALRPQPLEESGLPQALTEVAERWSALNTVDAEVNTTGNARALHPEVEATLLRTAQEALANVARHAKATRVGLTLSYMEDQITLDVRDDGIGFDPQAVADGHQHQHQQQQHGHGHGKDAGTLNGTGIDIGGYGLTAMRQRVDRLAGTLEIESEPGSGTAISASLPAINATAGRP